MKYFDFHAHILLKQLFEDNPNVDSEISQGDVGLVPQLCSDLPYIIETQIHQSQLLSFQDQTIVGAVLYGMESFLAEVVEPLRDFLKQSSRNKLSKALLEAAKGANYSTFSTFTKDLTFDMYVNSPQYFNVLQKSSFDAPLPADKINLFFVIEGCHSLMNTLNRVPSPTSGYTAQEIISNLDGLRNVARILSVNLTHLQQSNISNHAFGMQIAEPAKFYPTGRGLTDEGLKVVQSLFDRNICVDLKHMSYKSRKDLRSAIDQGFFTNPQPLLCTHAGFTGTSFEDWPKFIRIRKPVNPDVLYLEITKTKQIKNGPRQPGAPSFNMSTINLFDEEIVWIVKHGGMIGLSMDRRILGYVSKFDDHPTGLDAESPFMVDKEYFSRSEWQALQIGEIGEDGEINADDRITMDDVIQSADSIPQRNKYFYAHVLFHIKHFLQTCITGEIPLATAQKHLTIGSDFDGVINPFVNFQTCLDMPTLKHYIVTELGDFLRDLSDSREWADQLDVPAFAEDLFYNNG
ncbi:MAG TPA: hypothetical protein VGQ53_11885, partial [Chitinophagaceae bacterium]|nr:hypothetical protein [Chitinophagaceae bacterium]